MANKNLPDLWRRDIWNPMREISRLQRSIDRMFSDYLAPLEPFVGLAEEGGGYTPACNLDETDSHYLVTFDLPGVSKDEIKIEVRDNQLCVSGERKEEKVEKKVSHHATERFYGAFSRVFSLPSSVYAEKVEANYKDGILRIVIPKREEAKPKFVQITEGKSETFERLLSAQEKKEKAA